MADELDDDFAASDAGSRTPSPAAEGVEIGDVASEGSEAGEPEFEGDEGGEVPSGKNRQPELTEKERLENKKRKRKENDKKRKAKVSRGASQHERRELITDFVALTCAAQ